MRFRSQAGAFQGAFTGTVALLVSACGPAMTPLPPVAAPAPAVPAAEPVRDVARVVLPTRLAATTWRVTSTARLSANGSGVGRDEQRIDSRALVSWSLARSATGALRGTGQVDSFTVRSTLDTAGAKRAGTSAPPALSPSLLLLEATVDSAVARVSIRPPLANECDRPEASAASLARELLVRIPDGRAIGDRWRDSTVSLVCRSGVPMTVYTTTMSTLESMSDERLVITRQLTTTLDGKGGSAFRALELRGTGSGTQRLEVRVRDGSVTTLSGTSTLTLQLKETTPPAPARTSQLVQRVDVAAERVSR